MATEDSGNLILNVDAPAIDINIPAPPEKMLRWTVTVLADGDDLILPLPEEMLFTLDWKLGDVLKWVLNEDGTWTLRKKEPSDSEDA